MITIRRELHTVITGLGNMEPKYYGTRHNVGNYMVQLLQREWFPRQSFQMVSHSQGTLKAVTGVEAGHKITLMTCSGLYMNLCGKHVIPAWVRYIRTTSSSDPPHFVVVHDELDIPLGKVQWRGPTTSSRGHNGLKSLVRECSSHHGLINFDKCGVGIGRPQDEIHRQDSDISKHVLSSFTSDQLQQLQRLVLPKLVSVIQGHF